MTTIADDQQRKDFASRLSASIDVGDPVATRELLNGAPKAYCEVLLHDHDHETALFVAAKKGKEEIVDVLLELGADPRTVNRRGWTCLMVSLGSRSLGVVETLLALDDVRSDIEACNRLGDTALMIASHLGFFDAVRELIDAGARVSSKNRRGYTPLHFAVCPSLFVRKAAVCLTQFRHYFPRLRTGTSR